MNIFKDFQYQDYHGKKVPEELPKSEYQAICIAIESDYKWGSGWTLEEKTKFESIVYPKLKEAGFVIKECTTSGSCDHLLSSERKEDINGIIRWGGNELDLYMHPMEFTGYAKPEDTAKIVDVLKNCPECIYAVKLQKAETVYDLSDNEYERILLDNSKEIIERMATATSKMYFSPDIGLEFARQCRIPRFGDIVNGGYSSSDIDVHTVNNLYRVADKTGLLEKQNEKFDIQNEEQEEDLER